jgi:SNF2 family DNA or RNA helicase
MDWSLRNAMFAEVTDNLLIVKDVPRGVEGIRKEIGARKVNPTTWSMPPISMSLLRLQDVFGSQLNVSEGSTASDLLELDWGFEGFSPEEQRIAEAHPDWDTLYPFQKEAVEFVYCNPHAAVLLGLSPGLGKTPVSIISADLLELERVLVLAPLLLAKQWSGEVGRWSALDRVAHRAMAGARQPLGDVTITNHEIIQEECLRDENRAVVRPEWIGNKKRVKEWIEAGPKERNEKGKLVWARERFVRVNRDYLDVKWDLIVCDESVLVKSRDANRSEILLTLRKASEAFMWELTGSAITKNRADLFMQLKILYPKAFTSYWRLVEFFCIVDKEGWGWTIEGDRPNIDPKKYLKDIYFVRSQEEVLPDLPKYLVKWIEIEPTKRQAEALKSMTDDWFVELDSDPDARVEASNWLARSTRLQQITSNLCSLPKPNGKGFFQPSSAKEELLMSLLKEEEVEFPMIVWTWFVETTERVAFWIERKLGEKKDETRKNRHKIRVAMCHGQMPNARKEKELERYKNGEADILVFQLGVGKWGHNLTDTRTVYYHDRNMDADAWIQSLRRVRRIGLDHVPVLIMPWIKDSADELVQLNLEGKMPSIAQLSNADLKELIGKARDEFDTRRELPMPQD